MNKERLDWKLLGRTIGTGTGWDDSDFLCFVIYEFVPKPGLSLPTGDVYIDLMQGTMQNTDNGSNPVETVDLVKALAHLPSEPNPEMKEIED